MNNRLAIIERKAKFDAIERLVSAQTLLKEWNSKAYQPMEFDAKESAEAIKLFNHTIRLNDNRIVTIERHNGYVLSGFDTTTHSFWSIDLRNTAATLIV